MAKKSSEAVGEKILTPEVIIIGVVLSVILSFISMTCAAFLIPGNMLKLGDLVGPMNTGIPALALSFGVVTLAGVLLSRTKIDPRKYAVIYSMILVSTMYAGGFGYPLTMLATVARFRISPSIPTNYGPYIPWWIPPEEVVEPMSVGGASVPFSEWTTPLLILWTGALIYYFLWTSLFNIFRRQWIDIERIDFVWATIHTNMILNIAPKEERIGLRQLILRKRMLAALIIGLIFELQMALNIMFPWFPAVTAAWQKWPWVAWHPGTLDFGVAIGPVWFESLPGWTGIIFGHPVAYAIGFLLPVDILLTVGLSTFVQSSLIPMILWFMGMVPKPSFPGGGSRYGFNAWYYGSNLGPGNPYLGAVIQNMALWIGLGFFTIVCGGNWRYVVDTIKSAIKGPSAEEKEREPMTYRVSWLIFIVCIVLFLIWGNVVFGLGVVAGVLWLLYWGFSQLAFVRMKAAGHVNRELGDDWMGPPYYFRMMYPPFMNLPSTFEGLIDIYPDPNAVSYYAVKYLHGFKGFAINNTELVATQTVVETYKIGSELGIKPKDMFRAVTIASLVVMTITLPSGLWYYYTYGIKPEGLSYMWALGHSMAGAWNIPGWMWVGHPLEVGWKITTTFWLGFLAIGAIVFLRSRFVWFPLSPVGAVMGFSMASIVVGWGYAFFLTYFLKKLALRIGGVRFMEDWITPLGIGFIFGYGLGALLWGVASAWMFLTA